MPHASWIPETHCAIAQSLGVLGDAWDLLLIRDLARGSHRFEQLTGELGISRKVLTERLRKLVGHGLVERRPYSQSPVRHEYWLTPAGLALVPVLVALQDWGDTWLLGDGSLTGLGSQAAAARVSSLAGTRIPELTLPSTLDTPLDVVDPSASHTVLFAFPLASRTPKPDGWSAIPGAIGCTLENRLFAAAHADFQAAGAAIRGVSTQAAADQKDFATAERVPFPLLSDAGLHLTATLRLPTFRAPDTPRLRRLVLVIDATRTITDALFPITNIPAAIDWALSRAR
ncbi:winged helix-turn-helix transcriptional regulator [Allorhizocola rhizosphaerae]|uniref:winged helix-turn-helix transcriptional regulator n=1 Tax=Allorhizocola rhizosphaerae TaxID=1872709 RepID=UPI000E3D127E|nr:winged helix-turn-helix transcriptional regulator [Allorhizocola rhizosphaerae]